MSSRLDTPSRSTDQNTGATDFDDASLAEIARRAQVERAMILGELLAEGIFRLIHLPRRIVALFRARIADA